MKTSKQTIYKIKYKTSYVISKSELSNIKEDIKVAISDVDNLSVDELVEMLFVLYKDEVRKVTDG